MPKLSGKQLLQDVRTRLLSEATRGLIAKPGFDAFTMERVAQDACITKGEFVFTSPIRTR